MNGRSQARRMMADENPLSERALAPVVNATRGPSSGSVIVVSPVPASRPTASTGVATCCSTRATVRAMGAPSISMNALSWPRRVEDPPVRRRP